MQNSVLAQIAAIIAGEKDASKYLPFADNDKPQELSSVSKKTATIFVRLVKEGKMPDRFLMAASGLLDEMMAIAG